MCAYYDVVTNRNTQPARAGCYCQLAMGWWQRWRLWLRDGNAISVICVSLCVCVCVSVCLRVVCVYVAAVIVLVRVCVSV